MQPIELGDKITSTQLQERIVDIAHVYHWQVAHFRPALTKHGWRTPVSANGKGWPDLCLTNGKRLIFWECKSEGQVPTTEQIDWLTLLNTVPGVLAGVVYPHSWHWIVAIISDGSEVKII